MKPSERRKMYSDELKKRTQESYDSRDDSGRFKSIFEPSKMQGVVRWKPSEEDHSINIIPYIAGDNNPKFKKGKVAYFLDIYIHRGIGVNEDSYICLNRSFGKDCPICEYIAKVKKTDDYDEEYVKSLNPTRRAIYNIQVLDNPKEIAKGVQMWDVSHYLFEKELAELAKKKQGGGFTYFADPDEGKIISFRKKGEGFNTKYHALAFEDRENSISEELLDKAMCIEERLHIPTYEEIADAFFGKEGDVPARDEGDDKKEEVKDVETEQEKETDVPAFAEDECPCEQNFGEDYDKFENCLDCVNKEACSDKFAEIQAAAEEAEEEERKAKEKAAAAKAKPVARRREEAPAPSSKKNEPLRRRVR
jgi:hypothetical protein